MRLCFALWPLAASLCQAAQVSDGTNSVGHQRAQVKPLLLTLKHTGAASKKKRRKPVKILQQRDELSSATTTTDPLTISYEHSGENPVEVLNPGFDFDPQAVDSLAHNPHTSTPPLAPTSVEHGDVDHQDVVSTFPSLPPYWQQDKVSPHFALPENPNSPNTSTEQSAEPVSSVTDAVDNASTKVATNNSTDGTTESSNSTNETSAHPHPHPHPTNQSPLATTTVGEYKVDVAPPNSTTSGLEPSTQLPKKTVSTSDFPPGSNEYRDYKDEVSIDKSLNMGEKQTATTAESTTAIGNSTATTVDKADVFAQKMENAILGSSNAHSSPARNSTETPVSTNSTETPVSTNSTETPVSTNSTETPVSTNSTETPVSSNFTMQSSTLDTSTTESSTVSIHHFNASIDHTGFEDKLPDHDVLTFEDEIEKEELKERKERLNASVPHFNATSPSSTETTHVVLPDNEPVHEITNEVETHEPLQISSLKGNVSKAIKEFFGDATSIIGANVLNNESTVLNVTEIQPNATLQYEEYGIDTNATETATVSSAEGDTLSSTTSTPVSTTSSNRSFSILLQQHPKRLVTLVLRDVQWSDELANHSSEERRQLEAALREPLAELFRTVLGSSAGAFVVQPEAQLVNLSLAGPAPEGPVQLNIAINVDESISDVQFNTQLQTTLADQSFSLGPYTVQAEGLTVQHYPTAREEDSASTNVNTHAQSAFTSTPSHMNTGSSFTNTNDVNTQNGHSTIPTNDVTASTPHAGSTNEAIFYRPFSLVLLNLPWTPEYASSNSEPRQAIQLDIQYELSRLFGKAFPDAYAGHMIEELSSSSNSTRISGTLQLQREIDDLVATQKVVKFLEMNGPAVGHYKIDAGTLLIGDAQQAEPHQQSDNSASRWGVAVGVVVCLLLIVAVASVVLLYQSMRKRRSGQMRQQDYVVDGVRVNGTPGAPNGHVEGSSWRATADPWEADVNTMELQERSNPQPNGSNGNPFERGESANPFNESNNDDFFDINFDDGRPPAHFTNLAAPQPESHLAP